MNNNLNAFGVDKNICAAFTGYRPEKMTFSIDRDDLRRHVADVVRPAIIELYNKGIRIFLSGMAEGFDLWAAEEVLQLNERGVCPEALLVAVVPYRGQSTCYTSDSKQLYDSILQDAFRVEVLSESYFKECFHRRNDFLVDNSSVVIAYYDGRSGGTKYTLNQARRAGAPVVNVCFRELF